MMSDLQQVRPQVRAACRDQLGLLHHFRIAGEQDRVRAPLELEHDGSVVGVMVWVRVRARPQYLDWRALAGWVGATQLRQVADPSPTAAQVTSQLHELAFGFLGSNGLPELTHRYLA